MNRITIGLLTVFLMAGAAPAVRSQVSGLAESGISVGLSGGYFLATGWEDTHDAVFGSDGAPDVTLKIGYVFRIPLEILTSISWRSKSGHRIWPSEDGSFESADPVTYQMIPLSLLAKWRFIRSEGWDVYAGAGPSAAIFKETGGEAETSFGFSATAGTDWKFMKRTSAFLEMEYSSYPGSIGDAGASRYYDETDIGGITIRAGIKWLLSF